jgi:hypothetical protein
LLRHETSITLCWPVAGQRPGRRPNAAGSQPRQPLVAAPAAAPAAPDTLAALHRLFAGRRQRRNLIAVGAAGAALVGTAVTPADRFLSTGDYAKVYGLGAAVIILVDFVFGDAYSRKNEQRAVARFEARQLPRSLKRKLKSRYFR